MMIQILMHLWGDYLTQSDWMAQNKTKSSLAAWTHALVYSFPFLFLTGSAPHPALAGTTIIVTHFLIDRYRLARYVVWAKNWIGPTQTLKGGDLPDGRSYPQQSGRTYPWELCSTTGYPPSAPPWLAFWLLIIADNTLHLTINYIALKWL